MVNLKEKKQLTQEELNLKLNHHKNYMLGFVEHTCEELKLEHYDLRGLSFKGAYLDSAFFWDCNLNGVDFDGATLDNATFKHCDMSHTIITNAKMKHTKFGTHTSLYGANLTGSQIKGTNLPIAYGMNLANTGDKIISISNVYPFAQVFFEKGYQTVSAFQNRYPSGAYKGKLEDFLEDFIQEYSEKEDDKAVQNIRFLHDFFKQMTETV